MRQQGWKISTILLAVSAGIAVLFDWRISTGLLLGGVVSVLLYLRTAAFCDIVLKQNKAGRGFVFSRFMSSYALMAIPLILAAVKPEYLNFFATAAGLLLIKVTLILDSLLERREKDE